jgi:hypothetical protein
MTHNTADDFQLEPASIESESQGLAREDMQASNVLWVY